MTTIRLSHPTREVSGMISLDGSKSISNRVLIIRALSGHPFSIHRLSTSDDTQTLQSLLDHPPADHIYDVGHAGTTLRFLTAFLSLRSGTHILTGSTRMQERPIGALVDALRQMGCDISYLDKEGYPPLKITGIDRSKVAPSVSVAASISSQYITALALIAPTLPKGLTIHLKGALVSESYLRLTLGILSDFGIEANYDGQKVYIGPQVYKSRDYTVEADWSACSYHYAIVALAASGRLEIDGLFSDSLQGDSAIQSFAETFGVSSTWDGNKLILSKTEGDNHLAYDFINQPDIAQTIGVICAAKGISTDFCGLQTLHIKETDRIYAMDKELGKINSGWTRVHDDKSGQVHIAVVPGVAWSAEAIPRFETYKDHRMAMSLAPLALVGRSIEIEHPNVVTKSYPAFWDDLRSIGFVIEEV